MICMLLLGHILLCSSLHLLYLCIIAVRTLCTDGTSENFEWTWHHLTCKNKQVGVCVCVYHRIIE